MRAAVTRLCAAAQVWGPWGTLRGAWGAPCGQEGAQQRRMRAAAKELGHLGFAALVCVRGAAAGLGYLGPGLNVS